MKKMKKCYICKAPIDRELGERRFERQEHLYGIFTYFDSDNPDCKVKRRTRYLCENCAMGVHFVMEQMIDRRMKQGHRCYPGNPEM